MLRERRDEDLTMGEWFYVFLGGGVGSVMRYLLTLLGRQQGWEAPWPTLAVNLLGCLLMGMLHTFLARSEEMREWAPLLTVGLCGGFTTFSTFGYEAQALFRDGRYIPFLLYVFGSVVIGVIAVGAGVRLAAWMER